ncbi:MAG: hypothetical protein ACXAC5_02625 [Promethearchaeota archaeon]|jgi:hypothetical protein
MADIHILEGSFRTNGSGSIRVVYHIPIPSTYQDGTIASYPEDYTRDSQVADIDLNELEQIQMGTLYEYTESFRINTNRPQPIIVSEVRARWYDIQSLAAQQVRERYKYYGSILARS